MRGLTKKNIEKRGQEKKKKSPGLQRLGLQAVKNLNVLRMGREDEADRVPIICAGSCPILPQFMGAEVKGKGLMQRPSLWAPFK